MFQHGQHVGFIHLPEGLLSSAGSVYLDVAAAVTVFVLDGRVFEAKAKTQRRQPRVARVGDARRDHGPPGPGPPFGPDDRAGDRLPDDHRGLHPPDDHLECRARRNLLGTDGPNRSLTWRPLYLTTPDRGDRPA